MTPFIVTYFRNEVNQADDLELFLRIKSALEKLPDIDLGLDKSEKSIVLNCHMLARAVAQVFKLRIEDGWFLRMWDHSWLLTPHNNFIDVYPVGMLTGIPAGPLLIDKIIGRRMFNKEIENPETKVKRTVNFSQGRYLHGKVPLLVKELKKHANL